MLEFTQRVVSLTLLIGSSEKLPGKSVPSERVEFKVG
jgi:hypothetical protein